MGTSQEFDEITVKRINVVDDDGKLRLAITNPGRMPEPVMDGKTYPRSGPPQASLIFYNDDGSECGGLAWGGKNGEAGAKLIFDRYRQQDILSFAYSEAGGMYGYGMMGWDQPGTPLAEVADDLLALESMPDGSEKEEQRAKIGPVFTPRFFVGRDGDGGSKIVLCDSKGRQRLRLQVDAADEPQIEVLDTEGNVSFRLP